MCIKTSVPTEPQPAPLWQSMTADTIKDQGPRWWSPPDRPCGPVPLPKEIARLQSKKACYRSLTQREVEEAKRLEQLMNAPDQKLLPRLLCWEQAFARVDSERSLFSIEELVAVQESSQESSSSSCSSPNPNTWDPISNGKAWGFDSWRASGEPQEWKPQKTVIVEDYDETVPTMIRLETKVEEKTTKVEEKTKHISIYPTGNSIQPEALDLTPYHSAAELEALGMDRLMAALMALKVKCGGTLEDRAARLFSLKGKERWQYPKNVRPNRRTRRGGKHHPAPAKKAAAEE